MNINKIIQSKIQFSKKGLSFYKWVKNNSVYGSQPLISTLNRLSNKI